MITGSHPKATTEAENFEDCLEFFQDLTDQFPGKNIQYRGQSNVSWRVLPSLFRQKPDISNFESEIVRELISLFPENFHQDQSMFDRLVRMQHYGLPTRLLDVTKNPLVALYFGVEENNETDDKDGAVIIIAGDQGRHKFFDSDVVSCVSNLANLKSDERTMLAETKARTIAEFNDLQAADRLLQFIRAEKPYFLPRIQKVDLFRPVTVTPKRNNQRMNVQSGQFVIYGLESKSGPDYEKSSTMAKLSIKAHAKEGIRRRLEELSIDDSTLFPEIDKAASRVVRRFKSLAV